MFNSGHQFTDSMLRIPDPNSGTGGMVDPDGYTALYNLNTDEKDRLFNELTGFVNQILKAKNNSDPIAVLTYAHRILRNNYIIDNYLVGTIKNFLHEKKLHCHIHSLILGLIARHLGLETKYIGHIEKKYGAAHEVLQVTWKNEPPRLKSGYLLGTNNVPRQRKM